MNSPQNSPLQIKVDTYILIRGCPSSGPKALDFRRANGLPDDRADNRYPIERGPCVDETLFRALVTAGYRYSSCTDGHCEISAIDRSHHWPDATSSNGSTTYHSATYGWRAEIPASVLAEYSRTGVIGPVLLAIAEDSPRAHDERAKVAAQVSQLREERELCIAQVRDGQAHVDVLTQQIAQLSAQS